MRFQHNQGRKILDDFEIHLNYCLRKAPFLNCIIIASLNYHASSVFLLPNTQYATQLQKSNVLFYWRPGSRTLDEILLTTQKRPFDCLKVVYITILILFSSKNL